jgi:hypothetical protein
MQRDLDRRHSNSTRPCVHEHALALAQSRDVLQCMPRGHENDRQGRSRFKCQTCWNSSNVRCAYDGVRCDPENGETKHTVPGSKLRYT